MVAAGLGLDDCRATERVEPGEKHGRFDLGRGDRGAIFDRSRLGRALEQDRAAAAFGLFEHLRAHQHERIENAAHRALAQRGVAIKTRRNPMAADHAHHEPRASAGIAEIQSLLRFEQRAEAGTENAPAPFAEALDFSAQRGAGASRVQHVLAFEQTLDPRFADAEQAKQKGAMGNALVPRRFYPPAQRAAGFGRQGFGLKGMGHGEGDPRQGGRRGKMASAASFRFPAG